MKDAGRYYEKSINPRETGKSLGSDRLGGPQFSKKIQPIYELLKWKWAGATTKSGIPSAEDIERTICHLCSRGREGSWDTGEYDCSTGGITVKVSKDNSEVFRASLSLEVDLTSYFMADDNLRDLKFS